MGIKRLAALLICFLALHNVRSQDYNLFLQLDSIMFRNLADTVEKLHPVKIFYADEWVDSLYLNIDARDEPLPAAFKKILSPRGMTFIITDDQQLILSRGYSIKTNFSREFREQLQKRYRMNDTAQYIRFNYSEEQAVKEEYRTYIIGKPSTTLRGTSAKITGIVLSAETGDPVQGAVIYIDKLKTGVLTNEAGFYSIDVPRGDYQIEYRMVGMQTIRRNVVVYSDGSLDVSMPATTSQLGEVTVSANKENILRSGATGIEKIDIKFLKQLPMGLGETDLIKSTLLLPGVQTAGEASGGFNIRGGNTDQNLILFNGAPIINVSHFFGFFSAFNSDIIKDVTLYKSGIPAKYGGRISSVLDIALSEGSREKFNISGGVSPVTGRIMAEGPLVKSKASFIVSGRTTYSDWILGLLEDAKLNKSRAGFNDLQGQISWDIDKNNSIAISGYKSNDRFKYYSENSFAYSNFASTLKWKHFFSPKLFMQASGIISNYSYNLESENYLNAYDYLDYRIRQRIIRADFTYLAGNGHRTEFGFDGTYYNLSPASAIKSFPEVENSGLRGEESRALEPSVYFSDEFEVSSRLLMTGGLRLTLFSSFGPGLKFIYRDGLPRSEESVSDTIYYSTGDVMSFYPGLEYRLSARYILTTWLSIKGGLQRNFQYLNMLSNTTSMSPTDIWKLSDSYFRPQRGDQISAGLYATNRLTATEISAEGYFKSVNNIIDYKGGAELLMNEHPETEILNSRGKAYGIELMLKKQTGRITGMIAYTWSRAMLTTVSDYEEEKVNDGRFYPSNFDKPHDLKVFTNYKASRRINFTGNLMYSTGRPVTYPVAYYQTGDVTRVFYSARNEYRIPYYLRLDLSATLNGNLRSEKLNHSSFTFTAYNILGRRNPYSIFFRIEEGEVKGYQMSIFGQPVLMVTYNFRIRGSASTDF
jgi:hypothetical protein